MEQQDKIYFTLTGTCFYFGQEFLEAGMEVTLKKEPDNKHDKEAILVTMPGLGKIGYVANSPKTVLGESMSAGRLYGMCCRMAWYVSWRGTPRPRQRQSAAGWYLRRSERGEGKQSLRHDKTKDWAPSKVRGATAPPVADAAGANTQNGTNDPIVLSMGKQGGRGQ